MTWLATRVGITRRVFIVGRWAVKVPRLTNWGGGDPARGSMWSFTRGVQANLSEIEWSGVKGVNPVLHHWCGGIVNVYRRAQPLLVVDLALCFDLSDADNSNLREWLDPVRGWISEGRTADSLNPTVIDELEEAMDWSRITPDVPMPGDRKLSNLGVVDGRLVWIDFDQSWNGCPHHSGSLCWPDEP